MSIGLFRDYVGKEFYIKCKQNEKYVLDTATRQKDGGECHLWERTSGKNPNQIWTVDSEGHIMCAATKSAAIYVKNTSDKTRLCVTGPRDDVKSHGDLARWSLTKEGEIVSLSNPKQMFNVCGEKMANGTWMIMWHKQAPTAKNDKWKIEVVPSPPEQLPDIGGFRGLVGQHFCIRSQKDVTLVVDANIVDSHGSLNAPAVRGKVHLWGDGRGSNPNQRWTVDKYGHIINVPSGLMITAMEFKERSQLVVRGMEDKAFCDDPRTRWFLGPDGVICSQGTPMKDITFNVEEGCMSISGPVSICSIRAPFAKYNKFIVERL